MIVILDDTFLEKNNSNNFSYLNETKYKDLVKIYEKPTLKDFREIINNISTCSLFCNHKSLRLSNENGALVDGANAIQNLYNKVTNSNVTRVEFGRDMHTNYDAMSIDKNKFYSNLKNLLNHIISEGSLELKILFYGENYQQIEILSFFDKVIDEIYATDIDSFKYNKIILKGIQILMPNSDSLVVIEDWSKKKLSKKEIRSLLNDLI